VPPYATVHDVADRWHGSLPEDSSLRAATLLDDAHAILGGRVPDLADRLAAGTTTAPMLRIVICRSIIRVLDNPQGYRGEHVGERGYYYGTSEAVPGQLGFTRGDLADLGLKRPTGVGSIPVGLPPGGYDRTPDAPWG
jgi:hypothetical protein